MRTAEFAESVSKDPPLFGVLPNYLREYIHFLNSFSQCFSFRIKSNIVLLRFWGEAAIWQGFISSGKSTRGKPLLCARIWCLPFHLCAVWSKTLERLLRDSWVDGLLNTDKMLNPNVLELCRHCSSPRVWSISFSSMKQRKLLHTLDPSP